MAGLTVTVGGVDVTGYVDCRTIVIEEVATSGVVGLCKFVLEDHSGTVTIAEKDAVDIDDDGTTIFAGEVVEAQDQQKGVKKIWKVLCHDFNIYLDETVVESQAYPVGSADSDILGNGVVGLFPQYRSDINATTYVSTLDASMETVSFAGMTLREILSDLCRRVPGARYYVDYNKNLHWFDTESNNAAWSVSTSPDFANSYPFGGFRRVRSAARLANKVFVLGREVSGWIQDAASIATYGERHAVSRDNRITTAQGVTDRGNAILSKYDLPRETYELWVEKDGLRAGQNLTVVNATWGINTAYYIRKLRMEMVGKDGEKRRYHLWLNDEPPWAEQDERGDEVGDAGDEADQGDIGDWVYDTDPPAAPTFVDGNLTTGVSEDTDGHQIVWIKATWGAVSDDDLDHYEIQCADNTGFNYPAMFHVQAGDTREVVFVGLVGNTTYYLRVRAVDWCGNTSDWSPQPTGYLTKTTARDTTPPAQVTSLSAGSSRTLVGLQWDRSTEADLSYYEIQRADDDSGSPDTYATIAIVHLTFYVDQDFTDGEIAAQDTFWYRLRAVDTSGNEGTWATETSVSLGQIDTDHLAADCVTANKIAANTITANEIAANTITATELNVGTLSAITADMGTLTAGEIRIGTGTPGVNFDGVILKSGETYVIAGYDDDTFQAGLRTSDGLFVAGGGNVLIGNLGMVLRIPIGSWVKSAALTFEDTAANDVAQVRARYYNIPSNVTQIELVVNAEDATYDDAVFNINVYARDDYGPSFDMSADYGDEHDGYVVMKAAYVALGFAAERSVISNSAFWVQDHVVSEVHYPYAAAKHDLRVGGGMYVGSYSTDPDAGTVTIDQGSADGLILKVKSSDVAHGMTDYAETSAYGALFKAEATSGGLVVEGLKDADGVAGFALGLAGRLGEDADDTKSTAGYGVITMDGSVKSGTGGTTLGAGDNLFAIRNHSTTRFIFDADGEMHSDDVIGVGDDWDEWDDLALAADLSRLPKAKWDEMMRYGAEDFERAGLLTLSVDEEGRRHAFIRHKAMLQFYACCFREVYRRLMRCERVLLGA